MLHINEGTLPKTGIQVYGYSSYETEGFLMYYQNNEYIYNSQYSKMPIESNDGRYVFQQQDEDGYMFGLAVFSFTRMQDLDKEQIGNYLILDDIAFLNNVTVKTIKSNVAGKIYIESVNASRTISSYYQLLIKPQLKNSFTDLRDNKTYKTINIDGQWIMAEDLDFVIDSASYCEGCPIYRQMSVIIMCCKCHSVCYCLE